METSERAQAEVERLVRRFKSLSAPARRAYNEDNTRKDFILPLFRALEWQVDSAAEVSAEAKVSRGWVDFSFRLGGIPRFFLETKRIAENLDDPRWVRQAIDYAWTKSVTWAVLSDFEGLRVFNAEWREDNPLRAQFLEFDVDSYLTEFDRLWWLSRPETASGRLDREAEKVGKKARRQPVSQHLFDDLKVWRSELFRHLRAYNPGRSPAQIDTAVLRLLNRLIFMRTAEDREVESRRLLALLRELRDQNRIGRLLPELKKLFREFDRIYDSELFAPHFSDELDCEPRPFETLIEELYGRRYVLYNFNAIDADVLGTAYEQYLGHVIADPDAAEVVEKRRKRKSQGIYYTPTFVVKYIVQQTLGRYLQEHSYNPARPVRVLDMACGSGSFLIEAFDVLDRHVAQLRAQTHGAGEDIHDYARRMEILTQCIYGVDKDEQAVAVARLNLLLKALHGRERLPLLTNLRTGDSLISGAPDELEAAFGPAWKAKRPFEWEREFPETFPGPDLAGLRDPRGLGGGESGFDVIVGNPPYVRANNMDKAERGFWTTAGKFTATTGKFDTYVLFLEQGIRFLRPGGRLGFIVPYPFLSQNYSRLIRQRILETCCIESLYDLSEQRVFQEAVVSTCVLILRREPDPRIREANLVRVLRAPSNRQPASQWSVPQSAFGLADQNMFRLNATVDAVAIGAKALSISRPLADFCYVGVGIDVHDSKAGADKSTRISDRPKSKRSRPYVEGKEIGRYLPPQWSRYLDYVPEKMHRPKYPEMFETEKMLVQVVVGREGIIATLDREHLYAEQTLSICLPKHVLAFTGKKDTEATDEQIHLSREHQLLYILALLCSRFINWYFKVWLSDKLHVVPENLRQLPIRTLDLSNPADKAQHDAIVALVEEMLQLQKDHAEAERNLDDRRHALQRRIAQVDAEIDRRVYDLYGLTVAEVALVEEGGK